MIPKLSLDAKDATNLDRLLEATELQAFIAGFNAAYTERDRNHARREAYAIWREHRIAPKLKVTA